jgi:kumamolisin
VSKAVELYNFPTTDASDQTIGIISCGGGYLQSDIDKFFAGKTAPTLTDISLLADGQIFSNANSQINTINGNNVENFGAQLETTFDIQVAGTAAPGCSINIYFTGNTENGWHTFLNRILQPPSEKQPTVVSCSWALEIWDDNAEGSGTGTTGLTNFQVLSDQFRVLAAQGVNVFADTG